MVGVVVNNVLFYWLLIREYGFLLLFLFNLLCGFKLGIVIEIWLRERGSYLEYF